MDRRKPRRKSQGWGSGLRVGAALLAVLFAWFFLAPTQLGGSFSYFHVVGDSMEPTVVRGDLVLLRTADRYEVGDVVAYRDPFLGAVLHRIREVSGDRFILRGDNRSSDDAFQPAVEDIIGREWHVVRDGGDAIRAAQSPTSTMLLTGGTVVIGALSMGRRSRRKANAKQSRGGAPGRGAGGSLADRSPAGNMLLSVAGLAFMLAALGAALLFANDSTHVATRDVAYEHTGRFTYTAVAGTGVYDDNRVDTGDPVFTQITDTVPVTFDYQVASLTSGMPLEGLVGDIRLDVHLRQENGWQRVVPVAAPQPFAGETATVSGDIDLGDLLALTRRMETVTGLTYPAYLMDVVATVDLRGEVLGEPFEGQFSGSLPFLFSELQLVPAQTFAADVGEPETVARAQTEAWSFTLPVVGFEVTWSALRILVILAGLVAVGCVAVVLGATAMAARQGEPALIAARYGAFIVDASSTEVTFAGRRVQVNRVEDLVKIARQDGIFIVHEHDAYGHRYHLVLPDVTYTYEIAAEGVPA